ncbi:hypothetical protein ACFLWN_03470, partial [Chloroflexota bacterium]
EYLHETLRPALIESLPAELKKAAPALIDKYCDEYFQQFAAAIPDKFEIDESYLPPEVMEQLVLVRTYISYFQIGYWLLMGFMVLLVLLIILVHRNVRGPTRELGITLCIYGGLELVLVLLARNYLPSQLPLPVNLPASLGGWLQGLSLDLLAPLQTLSIGVLVAGIVLLVISFIYPRRETAAD